MTCGLEISINGADPVTLESLNLRWSSLSLMNMAADVCRLTQVETSKATAAALSTGDAVTLYRDGTVRFAGRVDSPERVYGPAGFGFNYNVQGPWRVLDQVAFWHDAIDFTDISALNTSTAWNLIKTHASNFLSTELALDSFGGGVDNLYYKHYPLSNAPMSANLRSLFNERLAVALRWDYGTSPPTLRMVAQGEEMAYLDCADNVIQCALRFRDDLWPTEIVIRAVLDVSIPPGSNQFLGQMYQSRQYQRWPTPFSGGSIPQTLANAVNGLGVQTLFWHESEDGENYIGGVMPDGTTRIVNAGAEWVYNAMRADVWEGSVVVRGTDTGLRPGDSLALSNGDAAWASAAMFAQSVVEDYTTDLTTVQVGLNNRLDAIDRAEFFRRWLGQGYRWNGWWKSIFPPLDTSPI